MNITTRYNIGHHVWCLRSHRARDRETCTTCAGSGRIQLLDAAGNPVALPPGSIRDWCPACQGKGLVWLDGHHHEATITRLTLGQVRTETTGDGPTEISYMAEETGVGSGSIYREPELHPSRDEAIDAFFAAHPTGFLKRVDEQWSVSA